MDWTNDPELKKLRDEFIATFPDRADAIAQSLAQENAATLRHAAHKIAGAARTYGFAEVGAVAERLDDELGAGLTAELKEAARELERLLRSAISAV